MRVSRHLELLSFGLVKMHVFLSPEAIGFDALGMLMGSYVLASALSILPSADTKIRELIIGCDWPIYGAVIE